MRYHGSLIISSVLAVVLFGISINANAKDEPKRAAAAVEVSCVCTKYALNSSKEFILVTEELFSTSQMAQVDACTKGTAKAINKKIHFNCRALAKEDMEDQPEAEGCPKSEYVNCMPKIGHPPNPNCREPRKSWIQKNCPDVKFTY